MNKTRVEKEKHKVNLTEEQKERLRERKVLLHVPNWVNIAVNREHDG